jgi:hypothetical protein
VKAPHFSGSSSVEAALEMVASVLETTKGAIRAQASPSRLLVTKLYKRSLPKLCPSPLHYLLPRPCQFLGRAQGLRNAAGHQLNAAACSGDGVPFRLVCWAAHGLGLHLGGAVPSITQVRRLIVMGPSLRCISSRSWWLSLVAINSQEGEGDGRTLLIHRLYSFGRSRSSGMIKRNQNRAPS